MTVADLIASHEGTKLFVYDDATGKPIGPGSIVIGHPSIGTGRALDVRGITQAEAVVMFSDDLAAALASCVAIFGNVWPGIAPARQAALQDMAFELGQAGLRGFVHMIAAIKAGDWTAAATEALASTWAKQVPARAQTDAAMIRTGEWPT